MNHSLYAQTIKAYEQKRHCIDAVVYIVIENDPIQLLNEWIFVSHWDHALVNTQLAL